MIMVIIIIVMITVISMYIIAITMSFSQVDIQREYDLVQLIGEGWFSRVYLAERRSTREEVSIIMTMVIMIMIIKIMMIMMMIFMMVILSMLEDVQIMIAIEHNI